MDYTLETLVGILRRRLQDEEFDKETLRVFLNDSLNEILGEDKYPFMQRIDHYTADEKGEIFLPPAYAGTFYIYARKINLPKRYMVNSQSDVELKFIQPEEYFKKSSRLTDVYTNFANTLFYRIHKDPDGDGFDITHLYLVNPLPLIKDTDITPIPPQYMEALILGALARAEEVRDNFDYAQLFRNQQDQILTNMKLRYGPGNLTAQNQAKIPHFGGSYYDNN